MKLDPRHIDLALDVRRGLRRLKDVDPADAPAVVSVLKRTTDATFAQMLESRERTAPRAARMTGRRTWHGRAI